MVIPPTARRAPCPRCAGEQQAERGERLGAQDRALGVDVVLGLAAARQRHRRRARARARASSAQAARGPLRDHCRIGTVASGQRVHGAGSNLARCSSPRSPACCALLSVVICLIVIASFLIFVVEQTSSASTHQQEELGEHAPTSAPADSRTAPPPNTKAACTKRSTKRPTNSPRRSRASSRGRAAVGDSRREAAARAARLRLRPGLPRARDPRQGRWTPSRYGTGVAAHALLLPPPVSL